MSSLFARGGRLYACLRTVEGKWRQFPTGFRVTDRAAAERWVADREREVAEELSRMAGRPVALTIRRWVEEWSDEQRDRGVVDWKRNREWLRDLVVPEIGDRLVADVRTPHIVDLFKVIRHLPLERTGKPRAPRTVHNIHGVVRAMLRDAELAGHLEHAPAALDERQLGRKRDADPGWREQAQFTREEVETIISTPLIPWDRRVVYAIEFLAGARPGEAAALRWKHYDPAKRPLGCLRIAKSYSARADSGAGAEKGTKTDAVKHVPVHPTLAAILAEWKLSGWQATYGAAPEDNSLIVPMPPADAKARTYKKGEAYRPDYYSRRRWVEEDEVALGWRHRRHYDTRATFITLAVEDGAKQDVIRDRVTHTKPMRNGIDFYLRGEQWEATCREVAKLRIFRDNNMIAIGGRG